MVDLQLENTTRINKSDVFFIILNSNPIFILEESIRCAKNNSIRLLQNLV